MKFNFSDINVISVVVDFFEYFGFLKVEKCVVFHILHAKSDHVFVSMCNIDKIPLCVCVNLEIHGKTQLSNMLLFK
jgi:hypothetical protein